MTGRAAPRAGRRGARPAAPTARARPARSAPAERGQASIELVALLPVVVVVALAGGQLLAAGQARELAGNAAEAGAIAIVQGAQPDAAAHEARAALPGWSDDRATVRVRGRGVHVRLKPRAVLPGLAERLTATAAADAGPTR